MTDDYERDEKGKIIMTIANLEKLQYKIANEPVGRAETIVPLFKCPNPNNLEPHYLWFSCLLRCAFDKDKIPKIPPPKGRIVKYRGVDVFVEEDI